MPIRKRSITSKKTTRVRRPAALKSRRAGATLLSARSIGGKTVRGRVGGRRVATRRATGLVKRSASAMR